MPEGKILLLGSRIKITNLPIKEVSMMAQGSLPAYGYNPADFIELLAGRVTVEEGRLEECLTWLSAFLTTTELAPRVDTVSYGEEREVFQIFNKMIEDKDDPDHGWFMVRQILPPGGRPPRPENVRTTGGNRKKLANNRGIIIVDDGGNPPRIAADLKKKNPGHGPWPLASPRPTGTSGQKPSARIFSFSAGFPTLKPPAWKWTVPWCGNPWWRCA